MIFLIFSFLVFRRLLSAALQTGLEILFEQASQGRIMFGEDGKGGSDARALAGELPLCIGVPRGTALSKRFTQGAGEGHIAINIFSFSSKFHRKQFGSAHGHFPAPQGAVSWRQTFD